jgi:hypothetical protein
MAYLEALGLLILLCAGALALLPLLKLRRYLGLLLCATAVGAFVTGYGFGSRDAVNRLGPFLAEETAADAMVAVEPYLGNPLYGVGIGLVLILLVLLGFSDDVRAFRSEQTGRCSSRDSGSHRPQLSALKSRLVSLITVGMFLKCLN